MQMALYRMAKVCWESWMRPLRALIQLSKRWTLPCTTITSQLLGKNAIADA
ncbi:MAG: hypothetical protein R2778_04780 [Saprospiraceae bacterium]